MLQAKVRENSTPDVAGKIRQILNDMAHFWLFLQAQHFCIKGIVYAA